MKQLNFAYADYVNDIEAVRVDGGVFSVAEAVAAVRVEDLEAGVRTTSAPASGYLGVYLRPDTMKWQSQGPLNSYIACFDVDAVAARAHDRVVVRVMGADRAGRDESRLLNFPINEYSDDVRAVVDNGGVFSVEEAVAAIRAEIENDKTSMYLGVSKGENGWWNFTLVVAGRR